jgi:hypothetical protein
LGATADLAVVFQLEHRSTKFMEENSAAGFAGIYRWCVQRLRKRNARMSFGVI